MREGPAGAVRARAARSRRGCARRDILAIDSWVSPEGEDVELPSSRRSSIAESSVARASRRPISRVHSASPSRPAASDQCQQASVGDLGIRGRDADALDRAVDVGSASSSARGSLGRASAIPFLGSVILLQLRDGRLDAETLGTHRFELGDIPQAYDVFSAAGENDALKFVLNA